MHPIQWVFAGVFLFALGKTVQRYRANEINNSQLIIWLCLWVGAFGMVLLPDITFIPARWLGIQRGADLVVYIAIVVICYALFRITIHLRKVDREITELARIVALRERDQKDNNVSL